jgi:hypothetical protein
MQPLGRIAVFLVAVFAVAGLVVGTTGPGASPLALLVPVAVGAMGLALFRRPRVGADLGWAGGGGAASLVVAAPDVDALVAPGSLDLAPAARPVATARQVAAALGRAEARQWLVSGWFAAGTGLLVVELLAFGLLWAGDFDRSWRYWFVHLPAMAHPMVGMAVGGAHAAVTRARRDGAAELFEACPAGEATRTAGHLRSAWVVVVPVALYVAASSLLIGINSGRVYGPIDARAGADVLAALVLSACGAWLGVALARWAPWRLVPVAALIALTMVLLGLGDIGAPHWSNARQLSSWPRYPDHEFLFTDPPVWWHLLWLAGLGGLMGVVALARAGRSRRLLGMGAALAAVSLLAGVMATRPLPDRSVSRLASLIVEPARHQSCRAALGAAVSVCAYRGYERYAALVVDEVQPVVASLPPAAGPFTFRQGFDGDLAELGPEVNRAIAGLGGPARADAPGALPLGYTTSDPALTAARLTVALAALELPVEPGPDRRPEVIAGQARGVAALWLAARGLGPADARKLASSTYNPDDHANDGPPTALDRGSAWPEPCSSRPAPVAWAAQDLAAARALLARPEGEIRDLLHREWAAVLDPATTTDQLLALAGLAPVGAPERVQAEPVECSY